MTGVYQPDWDIDRLYGENAEQMVEALRTSILEGTVEVKHDGKANETGNFYVEFECRRLDGAWHPSGISVTQAEAWAVVSGQCVLVVPTFALEGSRPTFPPGGTHRLHAPWNPPDARCAHPRRGTPDVCHPPHLPGRGGHAMTPFHLTESQRPYPRQEAGRQNHNTQGA